MQSLHELEATSITGEPIRLSEFEGQLCLIVNVASR
jgi:glutathione peroxidase